MRLLTDHATFYTVGLNPDWTPESSDEPREIETVVWEGPASLGAGGSRVSTGLEPSRAVGQDRLRVPTPSMGGPTVDVKANTHVRLRDRPGEWVVSDNRRRTTAVLQRFTIVDTEFAEQVPR